MNMLTHVGVDPAAIASLDQKRANLQAMLTGLNQAWATEHGQPAVVHRGIHEGLPLSEAQLGRTEAWPSVNELWKNEDRKTELQHHLFPNNFMAERRSGGVPEVKNGPFSDIVKTKDKSGLVVKLDQHSAVSQKAIEECFRPYWSGR